MTPHDHTVDVLIIGGGCSGAAAAWQAAHMDVRVLLVEESPWLGGMITAAGVSAFDGNHGAMGTGFFRLLRDTIHGYYGGPEGTATGWISKTCFEPRVGARIFREFLAATDAEVWHHSRVEAVHLEGNRVVGATILRNGEPVRVRAAITIEATEYGDVLHKAGIPHRLGRESREMTGEAHAPETPDLEVQDLTYCAILKKFDGDAPRVPRPEGYNPDWFDCATDVRCSTPDPGLLNHHLHSWESFITYAALPNDKYLLNWPQHANDSPDSLGVFGTDEERRTALERARHRTLCFVHHMQTDLGHPEWGLAPDEFGTPDGLAHRPYIRESRRVVGVTTVSEANVLPPEGCERAPLVDSPVAIGDYFLDHHHSKAHLPPGERLEENYPSNAPFQIPYLALVPAEHDGLLVAEKSISVTHIANGCSRLQPVAVQLGQSAGAAAALCVRHNCQPRDLPVGELLEYLVTREKMALLPTRDLLPTSPYFEVVQTLAARRLLADTTPMHLNLDAPMTAEFAEKCFGDNLTRIGATEAEMAALANHYVDRTRGQFLQKVHDIAERQRGAV